MATTVHVWTIPLDHQPESVPLLLDVLSGQERVRAARLRTTELRLRFVVAHGALRRILAGYLGVAPAALRFDTTEAGKPFIASSPLSFNLSHSDGLSVCAVAMGGRIGVDVERVRGIDDAEAIVAGYFAAGEVQQYAAVLPSERTAAFFSTWTRKEAFLKAVGSGLPRGLGSFEVEVSPHAACPKMVLEGDESSVSWSLRSFAPRPGYAAAVALDRDITALELFDWSAVTLAADTSHRFAIH